ncbi:unnamed protein product, partial [marine sediment metagenome]
KINEDEVSRTIHKTDKLDLRIYKERLLSIKAILEGLPVKKTQPDAITLKAYNEMARSMHEDHGVFVDEARELLKELKAIFDAGQLPKKYVQPLQEFNEWLKQF